MQNIVHTLRCVECQHVNVYDGAEHGLFSWSNTIIVSHRLLRRCVMVVLLLISCLFIDVYVDVFIFI